MSWKSNVTLELSVYLPPGTRPGVSALFHTVLQGGFSCLYHGPLGCLSFIRLPPSFAVYTIKGCVVQWKGQTPRLFLPLRPLPTSLRLTFGIP